MAEQPSIPNVPPRALLAGTEAKPASDNGYEVQKPTST